MSAFPEQTFSDSFSFEPLDWRMEQPISSAHQVQPLMNASSVNILDKQPSHAGSTKKKTKRSSKKAAQDPTKPRRMLNAYNLFFQHHRQAILEELPEKQESEKPVSSHGKISFANLAKEISSRWKKATPEEKAYFESLSAQDKVRYENEMNEWKEKKRLQQQQQVLKAKQEQQPVVATSTATTTNETKMMDRAGLDRLAMALGDDCLAFIRAFR